MVKIFRYFLFASFFFQLYLEAEMHPLYPKEETPTDLSKPLKLCRVYENNAIEENAAASDNVNNFIPQPRGKLISIDVKLTNMNWQIDLGGEIIARPFIFDEHLIVLSANTRKDKEESNHDLVIRSIDKKSGIVNWQSEIIGNRVNDNRLESESFTKERLKAFVFKVEFDKYVLIIENNVFLMSSKNGEIINRKRVEEQISTEPLIKNNQIIYGTKNKKIQALSILTLDAVEIVETSTIPSILYYSQNDLVYADATGNLFKTERKTNQTKAFKQKKLFRAGGKIISIDAFKDYYLVGSLDNFIYLVSKRDGETKWKRRFANRLSYAPVIFEKYALLQNIEDALIWVVDLETGTLINKIELPEKNFPNGIPHIVQPYISLQTNRGILLFASEINCRKEE